MSRLLLAVASVVALFVAAPAHAQVEGLPIGWAWSSTTDEITITLEAYDTMSDLELVITRAHDRHRHRFTRGSMDNGDVWSVDIPMPSRTTELGIRIDADYAGEAGYFEDAFEMTVFREMDFEVDLDSFDADGRSFTMTMTQPAERVELTVRGDTGNIVAERVIPFEGEPAGTPLEVSWTQPPGEILTIDVKAVGTSGAWSSRQYVPWEVEFDAVFVHFASGSSEIPESDMPVLRARLAEILTTAERVSEWVEVKLYIAGYTDTVGSPADNQRLSESRARAIGEFFRAEGVSFPIFVQGFGESALAVQTADNVDEPENRRSTFILSTRAPGISSALPRAQWRDL